MTPVLSKKVSTTARWPTPRRLHAALSAIVIAALLLFLAVLSGVSQRRHAMQTVGKDSVPSILAAQRIKASLADMDANIANELMVGRGENSQSVKGYDDDRTAVTQSLVRAAENITYGDAERKPIQALTYGLGTYEELAARARELHERQDPSAIAVYRQADQTLHDTLFPAADALARANNDMLTQTYAGVQAASALSFGLVILMGLVLLAALIATQIFLSQRMRRTLNPALLAATLATLGLLVYTLSAFRAEVYHLKIAKEDAFTSLKALWEARSVAYDANTDESRWLLDRQKATEYEDAFFSKTAQLVGFSKEEMYAKMAQASAQGQLPSGTQGLLAQELANITFDGEKEAATEMLRTYGVYIGLDKKIRDLENGGNHTEAVRFCISMAPGESNWAFSQFDNALGKTLDINQHAFDGAVEQGFGAINGMDIAAFLLAVVIAGLAFTGLRPRMKEYAF